MIDDSSSGLVAEVDNNSESSSALGNFSFDSFKSNVKVVAKKTTQVITRVTTNVKGRVKRMKERLKDGRGAKVRLFKLFPSCSTFIIEVQFTCTLDNEIPEVICAKTSDGVNRKEGCEFGYACKPGRENPVNVELIVKYTNIENKTLFGKFSFCSLEIGSSESFTMTCGDHDDLTLRQELGQRVMAGNIFLALNGSESFNSWRFDESSSNFNEAKPRQLSSDLKVYNTTEPLTINFGDELDQLEVNFETDPVDITNIGSIYQVGSKRVEVALENVPFHNPNMTLFKPNVSGESAPKNFYAHLYEDGRGGEYKRFDIIIEKIFFDGFLPSLLPIKVKFSPDEEEANLAYHCLDQHLLQVYKIEEHFVVFSPKEEKPFDFNGDNVVPNLDSRYTGPHFVWYDMESSKTIFDNCVEVTHQDSYSGAAMNGVVDDGIEKDKGDDGIEKDKGGDEIVDRYRGRINKILNDEHREFQSVKFIYKDIKKDEYQYDPFRFQLENLLEDNRETATYIFIKNGNSNVKAKLARRSRASLNKSFSFEKLNRNTRRCIMMKKFKSSSLSNLIVSVDGGTEHLMKLPTVGDEPEIFKISKECFIAVVKPKVYKEHLENYVQLYDGSFTKFRISIDSGYGENIVHLGHKTFGFKTGQVRKSIHYSHATNEITEKKLLKRNQSYYNATLTFGLVIHSQSLIEVGDDFLYSNSFDCSELFEKKVLNLEGPSEHKNGSITYFAEKYTYKMILNKALDQMDIEIWVIAVSVISFIAVVITSVYF